MALALTHEPRAWQAAALNAWLASDRRGIVEVATGGGKTLFAEMCFLSAHAVTPETQLVVLVPTVALLDQWYVSLEEDLNAQARQIAVVGGGKAATSACLFNLCVINSARSPQHRIWSENSMLVVDECHRAGSPMNAMALEGNYLATLGLSATPNRQYDSGMLDYVVPALGKVIYTYSLVDAEQDGVLSPFELVNIEVPLLTDEQEQYDNLTRRVGRAMASASHSDDEHVEILLRQRSRVTNSAQMRIPVTAALADQFRGSRLVIFHEDIESAERIASLLAKRSHSVTTYHSRLGPSTRRENLRLFRRGVFDVLVCCRALDEGINIPEVSVAIIAAATASDRQRIQRLGRVLRPAPGKDSATIVTLFSTPPERDRLSVEEARLDGVSEVSWLKAG